MRLPVLYCFNHRDGTTRSQTLNGLIHSAVGMKTPVESMRINFGAPGDRKDSDGNVWFSYPRKKAYQETSLDVALDLIG